MPSADALKAGLATIELELLEDRFAKQLSGLRKSLTSAFQGLATKVTGAIPTVAAPNVGAWSRLSSIMSMLPSSAARFKNLLSQISAIRFPTLLSLRNLFVGAAVGAGAAWPVKMAADIELLQAQLSAFVGDANAGKIVQQLQRFAPAAAQSFEAMMTQIRVLLSRGIDPEAAIEDIKAIAVVAGGSEEEFQQLSKAMADVKSATRLNGEEMRQFKNTAFNPFEEIAKKTGETMDQLRARMEAGKISFTEVEDALQSTVRAGGRFDGFLDKISKTLSQKVARGFAELKLAILPLGQELLEPFKKLFTAISGAMPAFAKWIKENSKIAKTILAVVAVIGVGVVAFTALGLAGNLLMIVGSGIVTIFGVIVALIGAILSPVGLLVSGLAGLAIWFLVATDAGHHFAANLATWFGKLLTIGQQTFEGIANALAAGDLELAAKIGLAGLHLAWLEATNGLRGMWSDFKDFYLRTTTEMVFGAMRTWVQFKTGVVGLWEVMRNLATSIGEHIGHALSRSSDPSTAADQDAEHERQKQRIADEGRARIDAILAQEQAELDAIDAAAATANATRDKQFNEELDKRKKALAAARAALDELRKKAQDEVDNLPPPENFFGDKRLSKVDIAAKLAKAGEAMRPVATFDTRLAKQMIGGGNDQELAELRKIESNTRRRQRGNTLPVV